MFSNPLKNLKTLELREDSIVADLGAGTGFYSIAAGHIVPKGKVYAVDIVRDFLTTIKNKVTEANLKNVEILWGNVEKMGGTHIADGVVDSAIVSNVFFQIQDKENFIDEVARILKPKGTMLFVEWSPEASFGMSAAVPQGKAREMLEKKRFIFQREINTGEHHYGMIFIKP